MPQFTKIRLTLIHIIITTNTSIFFFLHNTPHITSVSQTFSVTLIMSQVDDIYNNTNSNGDNIIWSPTTWPDGHSTGTQIVVVILVLGIVGMIPTFAVMAVDMAFLKAASRNIHIWTNGYATYICPDLKILAFYMIFTWPLWLPLWMFLAVQRRCIKHGHTGKSDESLSAVSV